MANHADRPASEALRAALTLEQWDLYLRVEEESTVRWNAEVEDVVEEIARHLPGLAVGIRTIGHHVIVQSPGERGSCCS
jgi:hypothetical protein